MVEKDFFSEVIETDVLVVGGGGGGLMAALEAKRKNLDVMLISKGQVYKSGATPIAGADLTLDGKSLHDLGFPGVPTDSKDKFFNDIVTQGFYLNNQDLVELYVENAPIVIKELLDLGLKVNYTEERAIDTDGINITYRLFREAKNIGVNFLDNVMLVELLTNEGKISGGIAFNVLTGEFLIIKAKSIIIATGGWHKAYKFNAGSLDLSGDGQAIAFRAGAYLGNMEFVTFCANILYWPPMWKGNLYTYILHMIIDGKLLNSNGENIFQNYDEEIVKIGSTTEWNKCFISNISYKEIKEGRGSLHGGIYFPIDKNKLDQIEKEVGKYYPNWKYKGIDFSELRNLILNGKYLEVGPGAEYFEGGIVIDEKCSTTVPGLYAAGEVTMSLFGANRVAAATTEALVEGKIAGYYASEYALKNNFNSLNELQLQRFKNKINDLLKRRDGIRTSTILKDIQNMAWEKMGPIRNSSGIQEFINFINKIKNYDFNKIYIESDSKKYNKSLINYFEIENMITVLELSAKAALYRKESRGVHYREDFPYTDNINWLKEIIFVNDKDIKLLERPVRLKRLFPPRLIFPYFDMMKILMKSHSDTPGSH
jgi:succinate dehydrogenase/fumarate reductase flavoprotein subunit